MQHPVAAWTQTLFAGHSASLVQPLHTIPMATQTKLPSTSVVHSHPPPEPQDTPSVQKSPPDEHRGGAVVVVVVVVGAGVVVVVVVVGVTHLPC
jgi:hypothetical protein